MNYYIITFHYVKTDGTHGAMVGRPMLFESRQGALDYGIINAKDRDVDFKITETVLFSDPVKNNG